MYLKGYRFNYRKSEGKIFISVSKNTYCRRLHEGVQLDPPLQHQVL